MSMRGVHRGPRDQGGDRKRSAHAFLSGGSILHASDRTVSPTLCTTSHGSRTVKMIEKTFARRATRRSGSRDDDNQKYSVGLVAASRPVLDHELTQDPRWPRGGRVGRAGSVRRKVDLGVIVIRVPPTRVIGTPQYVVPQNTQFRVV